MEMWRDYHPQMSHLQILRAARPPTRNMQALPSDTIPRLTEPNCHHPYYSSCERVVWRTSSWPHHSDEFTD